MLLFRLRLLQRPSREVETTVFDLTSRNIAHPDPPIELIQGSHKHLVAWHRDPADHLIVVFLGPPWANELRPDTGLNLGDEPTKGPELRNPPDLVFSRDGSNALRTAIGFNSSRVDDGVLWSCWGSQRRVALAHQASPCKRLRRRSPA